MTLVPVLIPCLEAHQEMMFSIAIQKVNDLHIFDRRLYFAEIESKKFPRKIAEIALEEESPSERRPRTLGIIDVNLAFDGRDERSPKSIIEDVSYFEAVHYAPEPSYPSSMSQVWDEVSSESSEEQYVQYSNQIKPRSSRPIRQAEEPSPYHYRCRRSREKSGMGEYEKIISGYYGRDDYNRIRKGKK